MIRPIPFADPSFTAEADPSKPSNEMLSAWELLHTAQPTLRRACKPSDLFSNTNTYALHRSVQCIPYY